MRSCGRPKLSACCSVKRSVELVDAKCATHEYRNFLTSSMSATRTSSASGEALRCSFQAATKWTAREAMSVKLLVLNLRRTSKLTLERFLSGDRVGPQHGVSQDVLLLVRRQVLQCCFTPFGHLSEPIRESSNSSMFSERMRSVGDATVLDEQLLCGREEIVDEGAREEGGGAGLD